MRTILLVLSVSFLLACPVFARVPYPPTPIKTKEQFISYIARHSYKLHEIVRKSDWKKYPVDALIDFYPDHRMIMKMKSGKVYERAWFWIEGKMCAYILLRPACYSVIHFASAVEMDTKQWKLVFFPVKR